MSCERLRAYVLLRDTVKGDACCVRGFAPLHVRSCVSCEMHCAQHGQRLLAWAVWMGRPVHTDEHNVGARGDAEECRHERVWVCCERGSVVLPGWDCTTLKP